MKILQEIYQFKIGAECIKEAMEYTGISASGQGLRVTGANTKSKQLFKTAQNIANTFSKATLTASDTFRLFARGQYDRRMVSEIVDILKKSGKYRINQMRYADSGQYWEIKRIGQPLSMVGK